MKAISNALQTHLSGEVTTLATLLTVTRDDGERFGFTDHDDNLEVDGLTYHSSRGYDASAMEWSDDLAPANLEVLALIDGEVIRRTDIEAGLWDYAQVDIALVNYMDINAGVFLLSSGVLGEVEIRRGQFRAELRGLADLMSQNIGELFSAACRATLGDAHCGVDLGLWTLQDVLVTEVTSNRVFHASGLSSYAAGHFTYGKLTWQTGQNAGYMADIWRFTTGGRITLLHPMVFPIDVDDVFTLTAGCDKTIGTCKARFNNVINFRGEPFLPGTDAVIRRHGNR